MSLPAPATLRFTFRRRLAVTAEAAPDRERWIRRRVGLTWFLLVLNVLTFVPHQSVIPIPSAIGKSITQGALPVALLLALTVNRKLLIRPNVFLCLVSLLIIGTLIPAALIPPHLGSAYRITRFFEFGIALWLLTPWWGRRDMLLARCHLAAMSTVLGSVLVGMLSPGHAFNNGRLGGAIWPIPSTQAAHYAAITIGMISILWFCDRVPGRLTLLVVVVSAAILVLTHTRTALVGLIAGLLIAGLSLIVAKARVRRLFAVVGAVAAIAILTLSGFITDWLARGEGTQQLIDLSGRTPIWGLILAFPRDKFQVLFGFGLQNDTFNGLAIDSNWLAAYEQSGLFGVVMCAVIFVFLFITAYLRRRGVQRALALFLITYCLLASFTEVGITNATTYLLDLTVAASLLVPATAIRRLTPGEPDADVQPD